MAGPVTSSHRVHKRLLSDQQKRRELALQRQSHNRQDSQLQARRLASALLSSPPEEEDQHIPDQQQPLDDVVNSARSNDGDAYFTAEEEEATSSGSSKAVDKIEAHEATKLKGASARHWFSRQFMLPEWMVDIPPRLEQEWYVLPRPAGKRCLVVSSHGTTISRLRNGRVLHCFPSALPNGARIKNIAGPSHMFCILDCIFHEPNQSYYIIDIICWRGYSLYDCSAEFRFFWLNSKIAETGACEAPSIHHRYQFHVVPIYDCDRAGLQAAYSGPLPYVRDGLLFSNRHAHYELGLSPLSLVWKDENCSQYFLDTDKMGVVPTHQHIVLELKEDGTVGTIDDPPVILASMPAQFVAQGLHIVDGKPTLADLHFEGTVHARAFADSCSKILFQYAARHSPLTIEDLLSSIDSSEECDTVMAD
ncbi:uncharacterized protein LOC131033277 isoform X2 [Cryptomeria japonica]|uniref:uncharacterized protein LOC131033277 isoform X2 n=1 Tax=Cryptomeria japonica TaxID=3369 RepID=UPI0027DA8E43|nr:uncharacterized protein LOC131033277 isoform X2 [Cryptomeria japonica]